MTKDMTTESYRFIQINRGNVYDMQNHFQSRAYQTIKNGKQSVFGIKKVSNNILDFVEPGDLIEIPQTIIRVDRINASGAFETLASREYSKVKAIYKRLPNGDFIRYEV